MTSFHATPKNLLAKFILTAMHHMILGIIAANMIFDFRMKVMVAGNGRALRWKLKSVKFKSEKAGEGRGLESVWMRMLLVLQVNERIFGAF